MCVHIAIKLPFYFLNRRLYMTSSGIAGSSTNINELQNLQMKRPGNGGPPPKPNSAEMVSQLAEKLNLTEEQKTKLSSILENNMKEMESQMQNQSANTLDKDSMKSIMEANMNKLNSQIKSILTDEQSTTFQVMINSQKNRSFNEPVPVQNSDREFDYYV